MAEPIYDQIAGIENGRDITRGHFTGPLKPEDDIVNTKGAGTIKIYEEMLRDDQVAAVFQQRRMAVTSREYFVDPASESARDKAAADFIREQLEVIKWDNVTDKMLYGVFYGYAVAECLWGLDGSFVGFTGKRPDGVKPQLRVRKARRFRFDSDENLLLLTTHKPMGERVNMDNFWVYQVGGDNDDNPYGMGLGHSLYWPTFFKRNGMKFWLVFLEKFGTPTIKGAYPLGTADPTKREILEALKSVQNDSAFIVPDNVVVDLIEAARSGTADYNELHDRMDKAIAKVVLNQTMTTEATAGQYKAEVQKDVRDEVVKGDSDIINASFTDQVVRRLVEWNFPGAGIPRVWRNLEDEQDLKEVSERDNKISTLGYEPTPEYIEQTYGPGWVKKQAPEPAKVAQEQTAPEFNEATGLLLEKLAHRQDQADLVNAARQFSTDYEQILGPRVDELLGYLEESGDLITFREKLAELLAEQPKAEVVDKIAQATFISKLMGLFRGQR